MRERFAFDRVQELVNATALSDLWIGLSTNTRRILSDFGLKNLKKYSYAFGRLHVMLMKLSLDLCDQFSIISVR